MSVIIRTETTFEPDWGKISQRGHNRIMRSVYFAVGDHWQSRLLPRHFQRGAAVRYGYKPRSKEYNQRKQRDFKRGKAKKPNVDLVYKGDLELAVNRHQIVKAFPQRATINIPGPSYLRNKPAPGSNRPDMGGEITTVAGDEFGKLDRVAETTLGREINNFRGRKKVRT